VEVREDVYIYIFFELKGDVYLAVCIRIDKRLYASVL